MNASRAIGAFALWLALGVIARADWKADFSAGLTSLETDGFPGALVKKPADAADIAAAEMQSRIADFNDSVPASFGLWLREDRRAFIELAWWRKRDNDRVCRAFVVALFYCSTVEPVASLPSFDVHFDRFVAEERAQRSDEFAFVMSHRSAIAERLAQALEKSAQAKVPEVSQMAARYRQVAAKRIGDPLR